MSALKEMADKQKDRVERQKMGKKEEKSSGTETGTGPGSAKTRNFTPPTPATSFMSARMNAFMDEDVLFEDPLEG